MKVTKMIKVTKQPRLSDPTKASASKLNTVESKLTNMRLTRFGDIRIITGEHDKHGYVVIVRDDKRGHWACKPITSHTIETGGMNP